MDKFKGFNIEKRSDNEKEVYILGRTRKLFYPTMILEVGQSFDFPIQCLTGVRSSAYNSKKKQGRLFKVFNLNNGNGRCLRIL